MEEKRKGDTALKIRLDPRRRGYFLNEELRPGFADDPALPLEQRRLIARWARHFTPDEVSKDQEELIASAGPPSVSERQRHLLHNQEELQTPYLAALFDSLDPDDQRKVQDPSIAGERIPPYPLSVGQLSELTKASERQIRKWADDGVLPSYREGSSRRFYSAAAIRAFALVRAPNPSKVLASAAARGEVGHHFQLLAATLGRVADQMPADLRQRLNVLAEDLSSSSHLMADVGESERLQKIWKEAIAPPFRPEKMRLKTVKMKPRITGKKVMINLEPDLTKLTGFGALPLNEADRILLAKYTGKPVDDSALIFTTRRDKGEWVNQLAGQERAISVHTTKAEALERGREIAKRKHGKHVVCLQDGSIAKTHDYG
jgi:excisionase family DNA binding protein